MADRKPIKVLPDGGADSTGLSEFRTGDTIGVPNGGTGLTTVATSNILTGNGASALSAESNLTFDGSTLTVAGALSATGNVSFDGGSFVFNESGADKDFRIEGDTEANLFVADASTDRIGIGTASPTGLLATSGGSDYHSAIGTPVLSMRQSGAATYGFDVHQDTDTDGDLHFHRVEDDTSTVFMTFARATGKISLNTASPSLASAIFIKQASADAAGGIILQHPNPGTEDSAAIYYEDADGSLRIAQATDASGANATSDFTDQVIFAQAGNVGIGVAPSGARLHLLASTTDGDEIMRGINPATSTPNGVQLYFSGAAPDNNTQYGFLFQDNAAVRCKIYSDGDVWTSDAGTLTSDERLKTNIADASDKLADLMRLRVRNYEWTPEYHPAKVGEKKIGFIAQELETVFPALISDHDIASDNSIEEELYDAEDDTQYYVDGDDIPDGKQVGDVKTESQIPDDKAIGDVKIAAKDHEPTMRKSYKDAFAPILVKALQEVTTRLEAAEAKITALESA